MKEKYGVTPLEFIDMKALMGDASDNIPGVPGIGEKTAAKIIAAYHSIEEAHAHAEEIRPPRASKAITEHWDLAVMSKELATIRVDADIDYEVSGAKLGNLFTEEAYTLFQRLEFKNLLGRFEVQAPGSGVEDSFCTVEDKDRALEVFARAAASDRVGAAILRDTKEVLPLFAKQAGRVGRGPVLRGGRDLLHPCGRRS